MKNKYKAVKTKVNDIVFDSKAEASYYLTLKKTNLNFKMQETFILQDNFKLNNKTYRKITYKPDFTIYDDEGNLIKVVDVKGTRTEIFNMKAKMFSKKYKIPITIAKLNYKKGIFEELIA